MTCGRRLNSDLMQKGLAGGNDNNMNYIFSCRFHKTLYEKTNLIKLQIKAKQRKKGNNGKVKTALLQANAAASVTHPECDVSLCSCSEVLKDSLALFFSPVKTLAELNLKQATSRPFRHTLARQRWRIRIVSAPPSPPPPLPPAAVLTSCY